jgi:lipid-A-disaccharide synthase
MAARERPDVAVLIDSWGFNLRVAHAIRRANPDVFLFKYVAPQVWATRPGRARTLARAVDHLLTIHTFDAPWFERAGLATTFVGNPVLARDLLAAAPELFRAAIGAEPGDPVLVIAPGSRRGEIARLLPPFADTARRLAADRPRLKIAVVAADAVAAEVAAKVAAWPIAATVAQDEPSRLSAMAAATVALACSGTVTTELAMLGTPMVVAYRLDPFTYPIASLLIRTPWITLLNVAAKKMVAPELIQGACVGPRLAAALAPLVDEPARREAQIKAQFEALAAMRGGVADPAAAAANAVIAKLSQLGKV